MSGANHGRSAEDLVDDAIGARLELSDEPPGVRGATEDSIENRLDDITSRMRVQFEHLRTGRSRRIPDAFFADEQDAENALQEAAAGLRAAMATVGVYGNPREVESTLAEDLGPTSLWARLSEASRVPRPATRPEAFAWTTSPVPWIEGGVWPPAGAQSFGDMRQLDGEEAWGVSVVETPYAGWIQVGLIEQQTTLPTRSPDAPLRQLTLMAGLEVSDGPPPPLTAPLSRTSPALWARPIQELVENADPHRARVRMAVTHGPVAALTTYENTPGAPSHDRGAGHHLFCLTPRPDVVTTLGLRPTRPAVRHLLVDERGPAMVCRQWRSYLIHAGDYGPLEPAVLGADLIVRPDLFEDLRGIVGAGRLRLGVSLSLREGSSSSGDE